MKLGQPEHHVGDDPLALLERTFIEEFLSARGYDLAALDDLPAEQLTALMKQASLYASGRLTEVESRAHFVEEIHDRNESAPRRTHGPRS